MASFNEDPADRAADDGTAFLMDAIPQLSLAEARAALAAHGGDVDRAVGTLLGM